MSNPFTIPQQLPIQERRKTKGRVVVFSDYSLQSNGLFELSGNVSNVDRYGFDVGVYGVNSDFSVNTIDISTTDGAITALDIIDLALEDVSSSRADLGVLQNRLELTINNLSTILESLSASRSRILDADFTSETSQLSRNQIIQRGCVYLSAG